MQKDPSEIGVAVMLVKGDQIYISKRIGCKGGNGKWQLAGGKVESGEHPFDCAKREVQEETGLNIPICRFFHLGYEEHPGEVDGIGEYPIHCFLVELKESELPENTEINKHSDWQLIHKDEVLKKFDVMPGIKTKTFKKHFFNKEKGPIEILEGVIGSFSHNKYLPGGNQYCLTNCCLTTKEYKAVKKFIANFRDEYDWNKY